MTTPSQFRLDDETLAHLDRIARRLGAVAAGKPNRSAAIRYAAANAPLPPGPQNGHAAAPKKSRRKA